MSTIVSKSDIVNSLKSLGARKGMALEVHCSLGKFGYVEGGAETLISALKHIVSEEGAIVMPSFKLSPKLPLTDRDREMGLTSKIKILQNEGEKVLWVSFLIPLENG